jgi:L-gulonolactone oxidase
MAALKLHKTTKSLRRNPVARKVRGGVDKQPTDLNQLRHQLDPESKTQLPIRPQGSRTASTDCNTTTVGTILRMTSLDRIIKIDTYNHTVTAQAGIRLGSLVDALAEQGLELIGSCELQGRTLGGAISAPCFGPGIGGNGGYLSSQVVDLKLITATGSVLHIKQEQEKLLTAFRISYGMLGVIFEATLKVRPIRTFSASHRRLSIDKFADVVNTLDDSNVGFKFYLMPYRDRVYLDLRRYEVDPGNTYTTPWKLKDWGESTVMPNVFKSLSRIVPIPSVRYQLIDSISEATQGIVNSRLVVNGNNAAVQQSNRATGSRCFSSTWCFPAANFSVIAKAYREFCEDIYERTRYRCDMPAVGYRICRDTTAVLSPSFDEPMIALTTSSTQAKGWEDFVIDLSEFAELWAGTPIISQSRALRSDHVSQTYSNRLEFFRNVRRQLDPKNRFLSPFLAQFFD